MNVDEKNQRANQREENLQEVDVEIHHPLYLHLLMVVEIEEVSLEDRDRDRRVKLERKNRRMLLKGLEMLISCGFLIIERN